MSAIPFASGKAFRMRHTLLISVVGIPAAGLCVLYLLAILEMTSAQWRAFGVGVGIVAAVLTVGLSAWQLRRQRPIAAAIDADLRGELTPEIVEDAFRRVGELPRQDVAQTLFTWISAGAFLSVYMKLSLASLSTFSAFVVSAAAVSSGVVVSVFLHFASKHYVRPLFDRWAGQIPDAGRRRELIPTVGLVRKLGLPLSAVSMVMLFFALLLSYILSARPVEIQDGRVKTAFTQYVVDELALDPGRLTELREAGRAFAAAEHLLIVDRRSGRVVDGENDQIHAAELTWLLDTGLSQGHSALFDSSNSFAWRDLDESGFRVLVAVTSGSTFTAGQYTSQVAFAALLVIALCVTLFTSWLLARDVGHTTQRLIAQASRVARGDLIEPEVVESDDEMGSLAHAFEDMIGSLREMIGRVVAAADGLEAAAGDLGGVGEAVKLATQEQRSGIEQATQQVTTVNSKVSEITESAQALNANVEEASSSVLELGAASEELNHTATTLSTHVEEVTASIDQMVRSVDQIGGNTENLAGAVSETASSMSEMAAAMTDVDSNASETARLSAQVVKLSERGQERVHETISGMDQIREATETADHVIRGLASRMLEIGAIVDVIDDVADETNLLALNAAIIAAQAGDQGRSFSVVADEIKDLADRVLTSTKEIGSLIGAVQEESANATDAIGRGSERVQRGVELAAEAGLALEEITSASRDSGQRIEEIMHGVREQSAAARHVAGLMERVHAQVEEIRQAGNEQEQGNEVMQRGAQVTRQVAQQTQRTTEEQSRGAGRIRNSMESIRDAVDRIHLGLQEQSDSCRATVVFLEQVFERTGSHQDSSRRLGEATGELERQATGLRNDVSRFRIRESAGETT